MKAGDVTDEAWDRAQAIALLLPALLLAWPGSPLAIDPATSELTATGVAALASVPAAILLAWRALRASPFTLGPARWLAGLLAVALLSAWLVPGTDPLERTRALLWIGTGFLAAVAGAQLGAAGRRALAIGAAGLSVLLLVPALLAPEGGYAGALGNTGELSNAALPGALAGVALLALDRTGARHLGLLAATLFLLHALVAPVLAALVALGLATATLGALRRSRGGSIEAARRLLIVSALGAAGLAWIAAGRPLPGGAAFRPQSPATSEASANSDLGGVAVRWRVARSTLAMVADHPLLGVGPGQFAAAFPPYRDPAEIELSSPGRAAGIETEVEHPHDDHLAILAETGVAGALLWLCFAFFVVRAALGKARTTDVAELGLAAAAELGLAAGALGILAAACANGPISFNPAASTVAFAFFGALCGRGPRSLPPRIARAFTLLLALCFPLLVWAAAWRIVRHGRALASFADDDPPQAVDVRRGVDAALAAAPDSVTAWTLRARYLEQTREPRALVLEAWQRVCELRPHRLEALVQMGVHSAEAGELDLARGWFERAAALDPGHPGVAKNRVRLELVDGELERGLALLRELDERGGADALWLRDLGAELLCRGLDLEAVPVLDLADERFRELTAERSFELANHYRRNGDALAADAFASHADRLWAREHAAEGRWDDARRMLRQSVRITRDHVPGGPARVRMELAASLWRSGRREEGREELQELSFTSTDWEAIPGWAREALGEMDVAPGG